MVLRPLLLVTGSVVYWMEQLPMLGVLLCVAKLLQRMRKEKSLGA